MKLAIASTFTAEPLRGLMEFWFEKLELDLSVEFAPYNQVFQELLDPGSLLNSNRNGVNLLIVRIEDWIAKDLSEDHSKYESDRYEVDNLIEEFSEALMVETKKNQVPHLVFMAPPSNSFVLKSDLELGHNDLALMLQSKIKSRNNLTLITPAEMDRTYHLETIHDEFADKLGAVPFTEEYFASMSAIIARKIHRLKRSPFKVIVCDCDNTLWDGVLGERGPLGIRFSRGRLDLQRRLVEQKNSGMLVCLSSKNVEEDVEEVFRIRTEMPLKRDDLTAVRINWNDKSVNIQSLADELDLGLDSFIFLDDNPVEIAGVNSNLPQVLTLLVPEDPDLIPDTLSHFWAFDTGNLTEEDGKRTALYRQNLSRVEFKRKSMDFQSFIEGLGLVVDIEPMKPSQVPRVAQLTQRTNQFNSTTIRRNEEEIQNFNHDRSNCILTVKVKDRFGDYGLVGVILYTIAGETLTVDTLLLSCRALGRGVEYRLISELGKAAEKFNLNTIVLSYFPSRRNEAIKNFFMSLDAGLKEKEAGKLEFNITPCAASATRFVPGMEKVSKRQGDVEAEDETREDLQSAVRRNEIILEVSTHLRTPREIIQAGNSFRIAERPGNLGPYTPAGTAHEEALAEIWRDLLKIQKVGIRDSFYELGGHSLLGTMCLARIRQRFGISLSFEDFFTVPTIESIASIIAEKSLDVLPENELEDLVTELEGLSNQEADAKLTEGVDAASISGNMTALIEDPHGELQEPSAQVSDDAAQSAVPRDGENLFFHRREQHSDTKANTQSQNVISTKYSERARQIIRDLRDRRFETNGPELKIEQLGIPTKNRVHALGSCVRSYGEHAKRFGREIQIAVFDDSNDPDINDRVRSFLRELKSRFGLKLFYAGQKEKRAFARDIAREGGIPMKVVDFAFAYDCPEVFSSAGNRNSILLHFAGDAYLSVDDDTICDIYEPPNKSHGIKLTSHFDSQEYQVHPTFGAAQLGAPCSDCDFVAAHEKLLGKNFIDPLLQAAGDGNIIYEDVDRELLKRIETHDGKIRVVINGIVGDCAWQSPFAHWGLEMGYLTFKGASRDRIMADKKSYESAFRSRQQVRFTEIPQISPRILLITATASFDHRKILPPFFPLFRGQDIAYEYMLRSTIPNVMYGQVTPMVVHSPPTERVLLPGEVRRSASAFSMNKLIMECAGAVPELPEITTVEERISKLGEFFIYLSNLSPAEFDEFVWQRVLKTSSDFISKMETLLDRYDDSPAFWAEDVKEYLSVLRTALTLREYIVPQELLRKMDYEQAQERARELLCEFGELLCWWPKMIDTSLKLRDQGLRMTVPV